MIAAGKKFVNLSVGRLSAIRQKALMLCALLFLAGAGTAALAADNNAITSINANQQGANVIVRVNFKRPLTAAPTGFSIISPARIALDFIGIDNATGKTSQDISLGDVRNVVLAQADDRSRLVFNLKRSLSYATALDGNTLVVTIDGSGGLAAPVNAAGIPASPAAATANAAAAPAPAPLLNGKPALRDIDFRRGTAGEGRVVIDLPNTQVGVNVHQQGQTVVVDFLKTALPEVLRRKLDVGDFGTPVKTITTVTQGDNVRMIIEPKGLWEQSAYQTDSQLVIVVKPLKEDPNKLAQGTQGYRGDKLSLNFQNVEVRSVLQVIADFTGLNIITSDTVGGNLTLRLKDVPWDQALDIVMQAKGLDMRKNGSVIWIAPKDELLTKEKLELEQRSQIAELEPLRTESFQLNYQKAEAFKKVFGIDDAGGGGGGGKKNSILSSRGSAVIDPRTNQLFVTDTPTILQNIRNLVSKVDIASRQVLIEARMVEANDGFSRNLGAKLGFGFSSTNVAAGGQQATTTTTTTGSNLAPGVTGNSVNLPAAPSTGTAGSVALSLFNAAASKFISLELSALEADGQGKIISSPRVVTADQQKALIEQGTEIPYQNATSSGATSVEFKKANLKLEVTPQITPDGNVILTVDVTNDSVGAVVPGGVSINTKHVQTQVQVENGGTVVIGGIYTQTISNDVNKVPLLGDIPVLGYLFKQSAVTNKRTELLIFLTPKVVVDRIAAH
ncbi:type IV pilus secretin PilQ family protein [Collimonas arenae]|uniref:Type IV pilus biogenesis and competence protein PilQ n=1 Tax=Collimonas arenae TaxID=279058 RepID=A0A127QF02_9BURK|nr:type IV pilus secretin PilQ [Collimonas arenae]AMO98315.1 type IV pilus secretin PilQ family protein [Collimonas arenae]AMP08192.1 type IV pilus secretin PilQ family protein [Collimonas arenae]